MSKRKYPRIPVSITVRCENLENSIQFVSKNLSLGGVFIETPNVFPLQQSVILQCKLPYAHGELKLKGSVIRHEQDQNTGIINGMAIEFKEIPSTEKESLDNYIQNTLSDET